ncbi:MAG: NADH-quinone oxidoreductase subunit L [Acidiferrobacteraceae bacterium]|nr:NADH-quinone oxidoreductase subunit L [Acidiferrobacteraceae bacterium]
MTLELLVLMIPTSCLVASVVTGLGSNYLTSRVVHLITIGAVTISFLGSLWVGVLVIQGQRLDMILYTWGASDTINFSVGFLIDQLSSLMMVVVTFVSLMVHIYTVGYMKEDPGYKRFFSYICLFTFAMLMLVTANNFLLLFFGWEAVGLVSYLLIGFWFERKSATFASLKAFLVNRVGDLGFLLGIAAILSLFGTLDYQAVFASAPEYATATVEGPFGNEWKWLTIICLLLFVGAMGKSAQVPLHVWLPDSMEGPTPISALIHAATMVTAGIFMVARMSPLFEESNVALITVLLVGAITAISMALVAVVQNDIKRVVAYSTLSQLGYMTVALGVSAYSVAIFHLATHAFFKALLFLAAGSVIVALHHEQDMRRMGGLWRRMPLTYITALIGTMALVGIPPFAGFFSKEAIIESVLVSHSVVGSVVYFMMIAGVFLTALYSFRLIFLVFHGESRLSDGNSNHVHESTWVITIPLILLAIPSLFSGLVLVDPVLSGNLLGASVVSGVHEGASHGAIYMLSHAWVTPPFWLAIAGTIAAWLLYNRYPSTPKNIANRSQLGYRVLVNKYGIDRLYELIFADGARALGHVLWKFGDRLVVDHTLVNGTARFVGRLSGFFRLLQSGYVYHYAFVMVVGLVAIMSWFIFFS